MSENTDQLARWRSDIGDEYSIKHAPDEAIVNACTRAWTKMLETTMGAPARRILEVGANRGINLRAISRISDAELFAIEPNASARQSLIDDKVVPESNILDGAAQSISLSDGSVDLAFTFGVLIHIAPDDLLAACREIHRVSSKYIICAEYFSKHPESITYRDESELLFKRDFGLFWLENFEDIEVVDYGFHWQPLTEMDDVTWWLFRKS